MIGSVRNTTAVAIAAFLGTLPLLQLTSDPRLLPGAAIVVVVLEAVALSLRRLTQLNWPGTLAQLFAGFAMVWLGAAAAAGGSDETRPWSVFELTWRQAIEQISVQTVPMAADDPTLVLLLVGVGLLTIAIDLAFINARNVLLAALPVLGGYLVAMLVLDTAVNVISIVAVCTGWLVLLASRTVDHERRWPRSLSSKDEAKFNLRGFAGLAVGLGTVSIASAVVIGLAVPPDGQSWLPQGRFGRSQSVDLIDPTIDLNANLHRPDERPLLRYTTSVPDGLRLRSTALTVMTENGWQLDQMRLLPGYPREQSVSTTQLPVVTQVDIGDYESNYLPVPYAPLNWDPVGSWSYDPRTLTVLDIGSDSRGLAGQSYSVASLLPIPDAEDLAHASAGTIDGSTIPDELPAEIIDLAHEITDGASSDGEKALALESWLTDPSRFSYDLRAPEGTGYSVLTNFLFNDRSGYCIHFASAMAVMAETLGIPARVAVGFTSGAQQGDGSWLVTSHDMHAWPELYFNGLGWVGFEPTVSISDREEEADPESSADASPTGPPQQEKQEEQEEQEVDSTDQSSSSSDPQASSARSLDPRIPLGIIGALLVAAGPALIRALLRHRRLSAVHSADRVTGAWRELEATASDLNLAWPAVTPRQLAALPWPGLTAEGRAALRRIAVLVERQRYAAAPPTEVEVGDDVALVSAQLYSAVGKPKRLVARLAPRSLLPGRRVRT